MAIGLCAGVFILAFWPIGALVDLFGFAHSRTEYGSINTASGVIILGLALVCGAIVSGLAGALFVSAMRNALRDRTPRTYGRSAVVWGVGCGLSVIVLLAVSPHVGDRLAILALLAMMEGVIISFADAWLEQRG